MAIQTNQEKQEWIDSPQKNIVVRNDDVRVSQMQYWKISGNAEKCEITDIEVDLEETRARLENLIRKFDSAQQPYSAQTDPSLIRYNDYEHLTRRKEWELV